MRRDIRLQKSMAKGAKAKGKAKAKAQGKGKGKTKANGKQDGPAEAEGAAASAVTTDGAATADPSAGVKQRCSRRQAAKRKRKEEDAAEEEKEEENAAGTAKGQDENQDQDQSKGKGKGKGKAKSKSKGKGKGKGKGSDKGKGKGKTPAPTPRAKRARAGDVKSEDEDEEESYSIQVTMAGMRASRSRRAWAREERGELPFDPVYPPGMDDWRPQSTSKVFLPVRMHLPPTLTRAEASEVPDVEFVRQFKNQRMLLKSRYVTLEVLGRGTFGVVLRCLDLHTMSIVCTKVAFPKRTASLGKEYELLVELNELQRCDKDVNPYMVCVRELFSFLLPMTLEDGRQATFEMSCFVMEALSKCTLLDVLAVCRQGMDIARIRVLAYQLLMALSFLERLDLVHADVKPSNILFLRRPSRRAGEPKPTAQLRMLSQEYYEVTQFVRFVDNSSPFAAYFDEVVKQLHVADDELKADIPFNNNCDIVLIDYSNSVGNLTDSRNYMQSRPYRSPEVLLGDLITCKADSWSLGCVLMEMFLGHSLFPGSSEIDQMRLIVESCGMPPIHMIDCSDRRLNYFVYYENVGYLLYPLPHDWSIVASTSRPGRHYYHNEDLGSSANTYTRPWPTEEDIQDMSDNLPSMWSMRESKSKPGVYVFVDHTRPQHSQWPPPRKQPLAELFAEHLPNIPKHQTAMVFEFYELVKRLLHIDPEHRISATEALSASIFNDGGALLS